MNDICPANTTNWNPLLDSVVRSPTRTARVMAQHWWEGYCK